MSQEVFQGIFQTREEELHNTRWEDIMKLKLSKTQWETIGKTAGWLENKTQKIAQTKQIRTVESKFEDDRIDGSLFGHPNLFYHIRLSQTQKQQDDSDYHRETGYGELWSDIGNPEINIFEIGEFKDVGPTTEITRTTFDIQEQDPQLYELLLEYAQEHADTKSINEMEKPYED